MSAVFRLKHAEPIEVSESWELDRQIADAAQWLDDPTNAERVRKSILDFGFNSRLGGGIAVQGETVPVEFMRRLVLLDITLWLSIYPSFSDSPHDSAPNPDSN
jgi:hypothetical protein